MAKLEFKKTEPAPFASPEQWGDWRWQMRSLLSSLADFVKVFELSDEERAALADRPHFPVKATPYYAGLASRTNPSDPIRRLILPTRREQAPGTQQMADPLGERKNTARGVGERLIHRYPDRVLFLITDQCSVYCRYCLRKHFTGGDEAFIGSKEYEAALNYIRSKPGLREIILSGGDPLTISDSRIERVLFDLRAIDHIEIIRIASRMPVVCPMRITDESVQLFRKFKPVVFMTHFVHPREITLEAAESLEKLVDHGVPVFNQMVLLNGVNNHPAIVQALSRRLLYLRVKPYYMFQCDPSEGTDHFRISVDESLAIQRELWGRLSGLAMPNLSLDIPGGGGKVGLVPNFETSVPPQSKATIRTFKGFDGIEGEYIDPAHPSVPPDDVNEYLPEWEALKGLKDL